MFSGEEIKGLVELFKKRGVYLYHSAQFLDFQSYLMINGVPSRALLEANNLPMTPFETDQNDRDNKVWDMVFLNPVDFGKIFEKERNGTPNVYGPISFVFKPEALFEAENVAVSLRSAGSKNFLREHASLKSVEEVNQIFYFDLNGPKSKLSWIKAPDDIQSQGNTYVGNPEISLKINGGLLSFQYLVDISVDPYKFGEKYLKDIVKEILISKGMKIRISKRKYQTGHYNLLNRISSLVKSDDSNIDLNEIATNPNLSEYLRGYAQRLAQNPRAADQWPRYCKYFRYGTIKPLKDRYNL